MRRYLLGILTVIFTWGQVASAFPNKDVAPLKAFLQKSGWTKHPVKLRDLYNLTKDTLPLEFRFEVERMLAKQPDAELPKLDVRMIKNGRFEDIQLIAQRGNQSATATLSMRGNDVGRLTFSKDGKSYQKNLTYVDVFNPARMMAQAYGPGTGVSDKIGFTRILHQKDLALLRPIDRQKYAAQVQEVLRIAEKAQVAMNTVGPKKKELPSKKDSGKTKKTTWNSYFNLLINEAIAASSSVAGSSCLILGWIGKYQANGGPCIPPNEAKDPVKCPQAFVCSKVLYGANAECGRVNFEKGEATSTAEICNARNSDNKYDFFKGIKSQGDFDKKADELSLKLNEIRALCADPKNEQLAECKDLETRMTDLKNVNCNVLKSWKNQYSDLSCNPMTAPVLAADASSLPTTLQTARPGSQTTAAPGVAGGMDNGNSASADETGVTVMPMNSPGSERATAGADLPIPELPYDGGGYEEPAPAPAQDIAGGVRCQGLPLSASGLDCGSGQVASLTCNTNNEARLHYYCVCSGGSEIYHNSAKPTSCRSSASERYTASPRITPERVRPIRQERSWWDQNGGWAAMLGGLMTVGVGFLIYYNQQQQMKASYEQYYEQYKPEVLEIAPPPTSTGPTVIPGTGTIVLPGTR